MVLNLYACYTLYRLKKGWVRWAGVRLLVDASGVGTLESICLFINQHLLTAGFIVSITIKLVFLFQPCLHVKGYHSYQKHIHMVHG